MTVTRILPNGDSVTRIVPEPPAGGGGGPVINYTTYASPWVTENPTISTFFGLSAYETAANAVYFVADSPVTTTAF